MAGDVIKHRKIMIHGERFDQRVEDKGNRW